MRRPVLLTLAAVGGVIVLLGSALNSSSVNLLRATSIAPMALGTIGPNQTRCFAAKYYQSSATEAQRQAAQSDRMAWQFAWTGQA